MDVLERTFVYLGRRRVRSAACIFTPFEGVWSLVGIPWCRGPEVGDFKMAVVVEEKVLQLDVTVGEALVVQVLHAMEKLLEETQLLLVGEIFDAVDKVTFGAILHDYAPATATSTELEGPDHVGMDQLVGSFELIVHPVCVALLVFVLLLLHLLYCVRLQGLPLVQAGDLAPAPFSNPFWGMPANNLVLEMHLEAGGIANRWPLPLK